jgi:hypothetical protein
LATVVLANAVGAANNSQPLTEPSSAVLLICVSPVQLSMATRRNRATSFLPIGAVNASEPC